MQRSWVRAAVFVLGVTACSTGAIAQDVTQGANPYQGEFAYRVGNDLDPRVEISGVRWTLVSVSPRDSKDLRSGQVAPTDVRLGFENQTGDNRRALVILLFEDDQGNMLARIECDPVRLRVNQADSDKQKFKLQSDVLLATRKLYLFCEIQK